MDFAMRKARADDGGVDDDMDISGNRRLEHWMHVSHSVRDYKSHGLPCKLSDRLRENFICWDVQTALRQRTLDHGGGTESESENARQSSGGDLTAAQLSEKRPHRKAIRTIAEQLRTRRYDRQNRGKTRIHQTRQSGHCRLRTLDLASRDTDVEQVVSHRSERRTTEITLRR